MLRNLQTLLAMKDLISDVFWFFIPYIVTAICMIYAIWCYHTFSLYSCINIIILKSKFQWQYTKIIQLWPLTVQLYQSWFSVSFDRLVISCPRPVSSTYFIDQMKKQQKFGIFLQSPSFTMHSLMVFPFYFFC